MKSIFLFLVLLYSSGMSQSYAKIINAYEEKLRIAEVHIENLRNLLKGEQHKQNVDRLNQWLNYAKQKKKSYQKKYQKTQYLVDALFKMDPDLFHDINSIRDAEGNRTDVYVEVVNYIDSGIHGFTNLAQSENSPHVYTSKYGDNTVSITITQQGFKNTLKILFHELGHVLYQVPNLSTYVKFYEKYYKHSRIDEISIGHLANDPSHHSVKRTMLAFNKLWKESGLKNRKVNIHYSPFISRKNMENN